MSVLIIGQEHQQAFDELTEWCRNNPEEAAHRIAHLEAAMGETSYGEIKSKRETYIDALKSAKKGGLAGEQEKTVSTVNIIMGKCDECDQEGLIAEFGGMQIVTEGNSAPVYVCRECMLSAIEKMKDYR